MEKVKKKWGSPRMEIQRFTPQEYVAACQTVVLDLYTDVTNNKNYTLKWDGAIPEVGTGVAAHMDEQPGDSFTAYNCGNGTWIVFGAIREGHNDTTINGEFDFTGGNGMQKCEDSRHQLFAQSQPYLKHHHFSSTTVHNQS